MSTHSQLLYHIVFSTKNRIPMLSDGMRDDVFAYMAGVISNLDGYALEINGWVDHVHTLVRVPPRISISDFVRQLKSSTSRHINESIFKIRKFGWQDGYGAFTVSKSQSNVVAAYIRNQEAHHQSEDFKSEYLQ